VVVIGGSRFNLSITRMTDGNFGNVSTVFCFPKSHINENGKYISCCYFPIMRAATVQKSKILILPLEYSYTSSLGHSRVFRIEVSGSSRVIITREFQYVKNRHDQCGGQVAKNSP